jgi:glucosamine-phosphate N-acetyltransferase
MKIKYQIKELTQKDLEKNLPSFLEALSNLSIPGDISPIKAKKILKKIKSQDGHIFVAINKERGIIGTISLLIEQKFIHKGGIVGHIEDVSTNKEYEKQGVGSSIMEECIKYAKQRGCYKIILDCAEKNVPFYKRSGFYIKEKGLRYDI